MSRVLIDAPRWLLLATLVSAPLLYGSTREWTVKVLLGQLFAIALLWAIACVVEKRRPRVHPLLLVAGSWLLLQAWWMTINAKFVCDLDTFQFKPVAPLLPAAPGSIARQLSLEASLLITGLFCVVCFVSNLAGQSAMWRGRFLITLALTGAVLVSLGAVQRITHASSIFWGEEFMGGSFFATYRNHDNAAAFINMTWPIAAGLFIAAVGAARRLPAIFWGAAFVLGIGGAAITGSRAGSLLASLLLLALVIWAIRQSFIGGLGKLRLPDVLAATVLLFILMGAVAIFAGTGFTLERWAALERELTPQNYRFLAYQVCLKMIPEAGWFGFGPGAFQCAFPYFTHELGDAIRGRWTHAHQDYLQTAIEWGYLGAIAWGALTVGGLATAWAAFARNRRTLTLSRRSQFAAIALSVAGVLLHALVDFPLQIASIQLYLAVLLGLMWSARHWLDEQRLAS